MKKIFLILSFLVFYGCGGGDSAPPVQAGAPYTILRQDSLPDIYSDQETVTFYYDTQTINASHFECSLDNSGWEFCSSFDENGNQLTGYGWKEYANLSDGWHSFAVRAVNKFGEKDETPATHDWHKDTIVTTITSAPDPGPHHEDLSATITFQGNAPVVTFKCELKDLDAHPSESLRVIEPCSSPLLLEDLTEVFYRFYVWGIDADGNEDREGDDTTWKVVIDPETIIDSGPQDGDASGSFFFHCEDDHAPCTFQCAATPPNHLEQWFSCTSPWSFNWWSNDPNEVTTFKVYSFDGFGGRDDTPAIWEWITNFE